MKNTHAVIGSCLLALVVLLTGVSARMAGTIDGQQASVVRLEAERDTLRDLLTQAQEARAELELVRLSCWAPPPEQPRQKADVGNPMPGFHPDSRLSMVKR